MRLEHSKKRPLIMGVINVTPDSFSGDGLLISEDYVRQATFQAETMLHDGADWLDVGGESSRPGCTPVSIEEELRRTVPVLKSLREQFPKIPIAIDTIKFEVAEVALRSGATILNDISALSHDPRMAPLAAKTGCYVILMHNKGKTEKVKTHVKIGGEYLPVEGVQSVEDVKRDLLHSADLALAAGITKDNIILDPGIGFGKSLVLNLALLHHVDVLKELGYPVLVGPSRKSFIGRVLDLPPEERLEGTAAAVSVLTLKGADILRAHDVKFMSRVAKMTAAIAEN